MGLFGKKKEVQNTSAQSTEGAQEVLVLGSGCVKCNSLEAAVRGALEDMGVATEVGHVRDFAQIAAYGVMSTPALVVGGRVVSAGRVLSRAEAKALLEEVLK